MVEELQSCNRGRRIHSRRHTIDQSGRSGAHTPGTKDAAMFHRAAAAAAAAIHRHASVIQPLTPGTDLSSGGLKLESVTTDIRPGDEHEPEVELYAVGLNRTALV
ncbi:hypothetical protein AOLI_G00219710 [Acnodon oligacanthus]